MHQVRLGLRQRGLERPPVDHEHEIALIDDPAFLEPDLLDRAVHARSDLDRLHRLGLSDALGNDRNGLWRRLDHGHLLWRRSGLRGRFGFGAPEKRGDTTNDREAQRDREAIHAECWGCTAKTIVGTLDYRKKQKFIPAQRLRLFDRRLCSKPRPRLASVLFSPRQAYAQVGGGNSQEIVHVLRHDSPSCWFSRRSADAEKGRFKRPRNLGLSHSCLT